MILVGLILLPLIGGLALPLVARFAPGAEDRPVRLATLGVMAAQAALAVAALFGAGAGDGRWLALHRTPWASGVGIELHLAGDGLSLGLVTLTAALGAVSTLASWREIRRRVVLFHLCICGTVTAATGVFLSFDLLLFVFFWEGMLVPAFILIALYGHGARERSALKFLIYNQVGGLALIAAVLAMGAGASPPVFDAFALAEVERSPAAALWLLLGMSAAFLVKLPAVPVHGWLPDAHTDAPTAGSILLAGVLLKTGAYGLYRFPPMLFPEAMVQVAPYAMALGLAGILYGGLLACGQTDAKRLIAYTSVSHMGFVLMGIFALNPLARTGAAVEMFAHAFSASALFLVVGALHARLGTHRMDALGGLQATAPRLAGGFAFFAAAALAMPGTANFVGEALVILGTFQVAWPLGLGAAAALVLSVVYATLLLRNTVFGEPATRPTEDADLREAAAMLALAAAVLVVGLQPQMLIELLTPAQEAVGRALEAASGGG